MTLLPGASSSLSGTTGDGTKFGVEGANDAQSFGGGGAIGADGKHNHGLVAATANSQAFGVKCGNEAKGKGAGGAIAAIGEHNDGLVATTANAGAHAIRAVNTNPGPGGGIRVLTSGSTDQDFSNMGWPLPAAGEFCGTNGVVGASSGHGTGVYGYSESGSAVYGWSENGTGVYGRGDGGFYAVCSDGDAGVSGTLNVTGSVIKAGGSFRIDHPLDPANKFLYHSFVESPDMLNVYSGTVALDTKGKATVTLPDWCEALNRDFRYQLTAIGQAAPNLHVGSEVRDNRFSIAGGAAGQKVSWLLTGIRKDAWAEAHRIPVEEDKPAGERGLYLHPAEHGQPAAKGIDEVRHAAIRPPAGK